MRRAVAPMSDVRSAKRDLLHVPDARASTRPSWLAAPLLFVLFALIPSRVSASVARSHIDQHELDGMRAQNPRAAEDFERGEALAASGKIEEGLALFDEAAAALPNSSLPHLRKCEALTALGHGATAVGECVTAAEILRTNAAIRATIRALVATPEAPTLSNVAQALVVLTTERKRAPHQMQLSSALCDVAERIGDGIMLRHCAQELLQIAPEASETRHALAKLDARCPPLLFWSGWLALGGAFLATVVHAARRRLRAAGGRVSRAAAAVTLVALGGLTPRLARADATPSENPQAFARPAPGSMLSKLPIDDADPESSVPSEKVRNADPLEFGYWLQDVTLKADVYAKHGDHQAAIRYYRALARAVPDRAVAFRKLCDEYEAATEAEKAIAACGSALLVAGVTLGDYAHYVHLILGKPGELSPAEKKRVGEVLESMRQDPAAKDAVGELQCEVGLRTSNVPQLEECAAALSAKAPNDLKTIAYEWALAMAKGHLSEAQRLIDQAQHAGDTDANTQRMRRAVASAWHRRLVAGLLAALAVGLVVAAGVFLSRHVRRFGFSIGRRQHA